MEYQTLAEKLVEVLSYTTLSNEEKHVLLECYLNPGIAQKQLKSLQAAKDPLLQRMAAEGLLLQTQKTGEPLWYPAPLALLFKRYGDLRKAGSLKEIPVMSSIDQWIKYPLFHTSGVEMKSSHDTDTVIKWLFELHTMEWDKVYCFGDYEAFIEAIGIETEQDWINERTKKQRKASVIATKDGQFAQKIMKRSKAELRDCRIDPKDFSHMFIMAFPDINTTVIGSAEKEVTFIHSANIAQMYTGMVDQNLVQA